MTVTYQASGWLADALVGRLQGKGAPYSLGTLWFYVTVDGP
jgi:hypothetical protein